MWIMLNNKPLDISKIEGISGIITLDSKLFLKQKENSYDFFNKDIDFKDLKVPNELNEIPLKTLKEDANGDNKVWGYFFYIRLSTFVQCYLDGKINGIEPFIHKVYSKVYSTKEQAQTALEYLLSEINEVYNKMVKVEI